MAAPESQDGSGRYTILIVSPIPVFQDDMSFSTMDLWARDINTQATLASIFLICPVVARTSEIGATLDPGIHVIGNRGLRDDDLKDALDKVDIVQIPGNAGWRASQLSLRILKIAKRKGKPVVLGVSSNRAKTAWLNSLTKVIGALKYLDIRSCQNCLAVRSDGVLVVGEGLRKLFKHFNQNIFVSTASWIKVTDIRRRQDRSTSDTLDICMASRLEKMKGMHIGLNAVKLVSERLKVRLTILGDGAEKEAIEHQVADLQLAAFTKMRRTVSYPEPFLSILNGMDLVLLTNLSDEQPRLVFDALSQGCIPICPKTAAYWNLGLDARVLYKQGSAEDLSRAILRLSDVGVRRLVQEQMADAATRFTIETMHHHRSEWLLRLVKKSGSLAAARADGK